MSVRVGVVVDERRNRQKKVPELLKKKKMFINVVPRFVVHGKGIVMTLKMFTWHENFAFRFIFFLEIWYFSQSCFTSW